MSGVFDEAATDIHVQAKCLEEALLFSGFWDCPRNMYALDEVYHYTTAEGLNSILQRDSINLWFTRWDCVNDVLEGQDVIDIYRKAGESLVENGEIDDEYWSQLKDITPNNSFPISFCVKDRKGTKTDTFITCPSTSYICCFSLDKDSLPMWNYYSKNSSSNGYNIKLLPGYLEEEYNWQKEDEENGTKANYGSDLQYLRVIYDDQEKLSIIKKAILRPYIFRHETEDAISRISARISSCLRQWQLVFKKVSYQHEREARMILVLPDEYPDNAIDYTPFEIRFRAKMGYLIPYVEVRFKSIEAFRGLTVGPRENQEFAADTVKSLVESRGYSGSIDCSRIRFRPF